jgi:hypothetical protein
MSQGLSNTQSLPVTDGAETWWYAQSYCNVVVAWEQSTASGWPRQYLARGANLTSAQTPQNRAEIVRFVGPFEPGDKVGSIELVSAGGDASTFNVWETPGA